MKLHELWDYVKSIYLILYGGLVVPFGLLTALDDYGIHDRIAWNEEFIVLASIPLVLYGLVWLWQKERKVKATRKGADDGCAVSSDQ